MNRKIVFLFVICCYSFFCHAQTKTELTRKVQVKYSQNFDDETNAYKNKKELEEKEFYDVQGNVTEVQEFKDGKLKQTVKYFYESDKCVREEYYDAKQLLEKKVVIRYDKNGFKSEKVTYNKSGKIKKRKFYTYEYY